MCISCGKKKKNKKEDKLKHGTAPCNLSIDRWGKARLYFMYYDLHDLC